MGTGSYLVLISIKPRITLVSLSETGRDRVQNTEYRIQSTESGSGGKDTAKMHNVKLVKKNKIQKRKRGKK